MVTLRAGHCKLMKLWQKCNVKVSKNKDDNIHKYHNKVQKWLC